MSFLRHEAFLPIDQSLRCRGVDCGAEQAQGADRTDSKDREASKYEAVLHIFLGEHFLPALFKINTFCGQKYP